MVVSELFATLGLIPDHKSWDQGHELVHSLHHALEAYLGYEGLMKVKELVEGTVEAAVAAKHLGERLGVSSEAVQELGYAADVTGASAESLQVGMQRLAMGLEHVKKKGTGPLADALTALKIPMKDIKGHKLDENLETIAQAFAEAGPNVNKTALAMEIFGRSAGPKLIPLLNKGAGGIKELREEAEKLGVVIDEEGIEKAHEFEIAQKKLGATLKGVRNEAVIAMLPALQEMLEGLTQWVSVNREAIASTLKAVLHGLAVAFHVVGEVLGVVIGLVQDFLKHTELAKTVLIVLSGVIAAFAVEAAINWAIAFAPVIAVVAAITAAILIVHKLSEAFRHGSNAMRAAIGGVAIALGLLLGPIAPIIAAIALMVAGVKALADHWDEVVAKVKHVGEAIVNTPGISHLIALGHKISGGSGEENIDETHVASAEEYAKMTGAPSVPGASPLEDALSRRAAVGGQVNNFGDTHIQVDAANMTPDELQAAISAGVVDGHQNLVRQAYNNLSGGRR